MNLIVYNYNGVIPDLSSYFNVMDYDEFQAGDALCVWNEVVGEGKDLAYRYHHYGRPYFVFQHGRYAQEYTEYKENGQKSYGGTFFAWSKSSKRKLMQDGLKEEQIQVVGCPALDLRKEKHVEPGLVVFAPSHSDLMNVNEGKEIWYKLQKMEGIKPVAKLLMGEHGEVPYPGDQVLTTRSSDYHMTQIMDLLSRAEAVVVQNEGTFAFYAYANDVPVISIKGKESRVSNACDEIEIDDLEKTIKNLDPEKKRQDRLEMAEIIGGPLKGNGRTERIAEIIKKESAVLA